MNNLMATIKLGSVKLLLKDSLDNTYEIRITQIDSEPESGNVYLAVTGLQYQLHGRRYYLVGSGEIFNDVTGILSFTIMNATVHGHNVTGTFNWDQGVISGWLRRDCTTAIHVEVTDISTPVEG